MVDFIKDILSGGFIQYAVIIGIIASLLSGIIGTFVVIKKITYISGGIAHSVLGGIGIAYFLGMQPIIGAFASAVLVAILIGIIGLKYNRYEDTMISALWAIGMAIGIIFMHKTPGYNTDLITYLFGNILMVTKQDIHIALSLLGIVSLTVFLFYRQFLFISFDEEFAKIRGINVGLIYILLLTLISITVVILVRIVGLILVISLLSLPGAISSLFTKKTFTMMILSVILGIVFTIAGIFISYHSNLPTGSTIILFSGFSYIFALLFKKIFSNN